MKANAIIHISDATVLTMLVEQWVKRTCGADVDVVNVGLIPRDDGLPSSLRIFVNGDVDQLASLVDEGDDGLLELELIPESVNEQNGD